MRVVATAVLAALLWTATASAGTVFLLDGRGWGHGVGMSQWGAEGYARHGSGYRQILAHYYPGTTLAVVNPRPARVLLEEARDSVRVGSAAPFVVVDARGRTLHLPARSVVVDRKFVLRHLHLRQPLRFEPGAQPLQVELNGYRGDVVVKAKPDGLMAVNVLPLDRYLRGVVPWEVPKGWHEATYEAQAVAARSYTLTTLHPGRDFDLFADTRSQMYGGIRAERPQTNVALGSTAGQVLTFGGRTIAAFYFSSSGGRTSSVHDAWPKAHQVPYLVSVADPYDTISPHHVWPTSILSAAGLGSRLGLHGVRDAVVVTNASGRARAVRVLTRSGWHSIPAQVARAKFKLGATDFELRAMSLDAPASTVYGGRARVHGWVRGLGRARVQELTVRGWQTVARVRPSASGRFALALHAVRSTQLRLAYNGLAGTAVPLDVTPRITLSATGNKLRAAVSPRLPLQVQRLTNSSWHSVAQVKGGTFDRALKPGSYRIKVLGGTSYASRVSQAVGVHRVVAGR
ncbi:MAG: SpoIID/LytB domain-containing protein [Actinobacteria bacterium]|nr:SpoIID/LytB domain-containing protein [Actinomycetota bacterium]